jgi:hypothetical protein
VWLRPRTAFGLLLLSAPIAAVSLGRRGPAWILGTWALLAWLPSGSLIVTLRSLVTDRAAYPALIPLGALLGLFVAHRPRHALLALLALTIVYGSVARERVRVFDSDTSLWLDVLAGNPRSVQARLGLALEEPQAERVAFWLEEAVAVSLPGSKLEAAALARLGDHRLRREGRVQDALPILERAMSALENWATLERPGVDLPATAASLALARTLVRDYDGAEAVLARTITREADPLMLLVQRAVLRQLRFQQDGGEEADALVEEALQELVEVAPDHPSIRELIASRQGDAQSGQADNEP